MPILKSKAYLLLIFILPISFSQAEIYKWVDANGTTNFSDKPPELISPPKREDFKRVITQNQQASRTKLKDIRFKDHALHSCINDAAGNNGYEAVFADEINDLTCRNVQSLSGIEHLTSLKELILLKTRIKEIRPLAPLILLKTLIIQGGKINDISPLRNLKNLSHLMLQNAHISNIEPIKNLSNLVHLSLSNNQINSISTLGNLSSLITLDLEGNRLSCQQIIDLNVALITGQSSSRLSNISINPRCESEAAERKYELRVAKKSLMNNFVLQHKSDDQQKQRINIYNDIQTLVDKRNSKDLSILLDKNKLSIADIKLKNTPIFIYAVKNHIRQSDNDFEFLDWLLDQGADINDKDKDGKMALNHLNEYGQFKSKTKPLLYFLLKNGANINYAPPNRPTILISAVAAGAGDLNWVKELIDLGANINTQDGLGRTALIMSYSTQFYDVFDYLLDAGADIHIREQRGAALIHFVAWDLGSKKQSDAAKHYVLKILERGLRFDLRNKYDREAYRKCVRYLPTHFRNLGPEQLIKRG